MRVNLALVLMAFLGAGQLVASTPSIGIDWMDGKWQTEASFIVTLLPGQTAVNCLVNNGRGGITGIRVPATWMSAVQISDNP